MSNILATLHPYSSIPPGSVYRGDGKFDILEPAPFTLVNVKRKDVNNSGTATFTTPGETIKTRLELRKLAQAEHKAQKLKAIALRREEVIAARYLDLTTRIAALDVSIADTQQNIATLNAQIQTITADLAASNALLATRTTALATAQASLAAATTPEQIATRTATLATRQTQYDTALAARDVDQTKLTTRQGNLATNEATLVTRTAQLATLQATFATFKQKRGIV